MVEHVVLRVLVHQWPTFGGAVAFWVRWGLAKRAATCAAGSTMLRQPNTRGWGLHWWWGRQRARSPMRRAHVGRRRWRRDAHVVVLLLLLLHGVDWIEITHTHTHSLLLMTQRKETNGERPCGVAGSVRRKVRPREKKRNAKEHKSAGQPFALLHHHILWGATIMGVVCEHVYSCFAHYAHTRSLSLVDGPTHTTHMFYSNAVWTKDRVAIDIPRKPPITSRRQGGFTHPFGSAVAGLH